MTKTLAFLKAATLTAALVVGAAVATQPAEAFGRGGGGYGYGGYGYGGGCYVWTPIGYVWAC